MYVDGQMDGHVKKLVVALHSFVSTPHSDQVVLNLPALN